MNKIQETNPCGRGEQLVGYLYGEATRDERAGFEQHLSQCAACRDEMAAFTQVRQSVGEWRAELLTRAPGVVAADVIPAAAPTTTLDAAPARRTAWDALREFFALSPAWLRFGSAAAAAVVCALAALALFNVEVRSENGSLSVRTGVGRAAPALNDAAQPRNGGDGGAAQLSQLIAERDAAVRQLEDARAQLEDSRAANIEAVYNEVAPTETEPATQPAPAAGASRPRRAAGANAPRKPSARRSPRGDDDLPRLLDLISGAND
ncbi:MAG: zf-HC2 domain-containing protein [Acidobacteria bacterium]|nr:zf-HC2 domain-containing protein [Acidobacteriota bacterium]MCA1643478.1 zf-HC2 domain-containing protein [Acidobacteriota bacterium]